MDRNLSKQHYKKLNKRNWKPNFASVSKLDHVTISNLKLTLQTEHSSVQDEPCWWDPIISTPGNPLSIDSFCQMELDQSLFWQLPHPSSVNHTNHSRPHYKSVTHHNSDMRYWSEAFTILNSTIILSCLSTRYSTVPCILSVWTFTYTSILLDFPFSFTLFHFAQRFMYHSPERTEKYYSPLQYKSTALILKKLLICQFH